MTLPRLVLQAATTHPRTVVRSLIRVIQDTSAAAIEPTTARREAGESRDWALSMLTILLRERARTISTEDYWEVQGALRDAQNSTALSEPSRDFFREIRSSNPADPALAMDALRSECLSSQRLGESEYTVKGLTAVADATRDKLATGKDVSDFAWTLTVLSPTLPNRTSTHNLAEALTVATEAVDLLRVRKSESDVQHDVDISSALVALSQAQVAMKLTDEALASSSEALEIRRRLGSRDSDSYSFLLAEALAEVRHNALGGHRGLRKPSLRSRKLLGFRRSWQTTTQTVSFPTLRRGFICVPGSKQDLGKSRVALTSASDALRILERLINEQSGGHRLPFLKIAEEARDFEAGLHRVLGDLPAALQSIKKATAYSREAVALDETTHLRDLAGSLHNEFVVYRDIGDRTNGMKAVAEAVEHFRTLERRKPGRYLLELVNALTNLAVSAKATSEVFRTLLNSAAEACQWCNSQDRDDMLHYRATAFSQPFGDCFAPRWHE